MRIGIITKIDIESGIGIITDFNLQEISFNLKGEFDELDLNLFVSFDIEIGFSGVIAVSIKRLAKNH